MTKSRFTLRGAHLLMWSSPLLLLVLVFTLTSSGTTPAAHRRANDARASKISITASTTTTSAPTPTSAPSTTTTLTIGAPYDDATSSTVVTTAPTPSANVANGDLEGLLTSTLRVVDIPLQGPGVWNLTTTSPSLDQLNCPSSSRSISGSVVLLTNLQCQLQIASATTGASLTWLLIPEH
ncbi:MAG: hypothetical protein WAN30_00920 [Acidimicrobiales bacterium]